MENNIQTNSVSAYKNYKNTQMKTTNQKKVDQSMFQESTPVLDLTQLSLAASVGHSRRH